MEQQQCKERQESLWNTNHNQGLGPWWCCSQDQLCHLVLLVTFLVMMTSLHYFVYYFRIAASGSIDKVDSQCKSAFKLKMKFKISFFYFNVDSRLSRLPISDSFTVTVTIIRRKCKRNRKPKVHQVGKSFWTSSTSPGLAWQCRCSRVKQKCHIMHALECTCYIQHDLFESGSSDILTWKHHCGTVTWRRRTWLKRFAPSCLKHNLWYHDFKCITVSWGEKVNESERHINHLPCDVWLQLEASQHEVLQCAGTATYNHHWLIESTYSSVDRENLLAVSVWGESKTTI